MRKRTKNKFLILFIFLIILQVVSFTVQGDNMGGIPYSEGLPPNLDSDLDGIPDSEDLLPNDYDNDGMPDEWENKYGLRYDSFNSNEDMDNDGIINIDEYRLNKNPVVPDEKQVIEEEIDVPVFNTGEMRIARIILWVISIFTLYLIGWLIFTLVQGKKNNQQIVNQRYNNSQIQPQRPVNTLPYPTYRTTYNNPKTNKKYAIKGFNETPKKVKVNDQKTKKSSIKKSFDKFDNKKTKIRSKKEKKNLKSEDGYLVVGEKEKSYSKKPKKKSSKDDDIFKKLSNITKK